MKIAIITANIGNIDEVIVPMRQTIPCSYFCFTEDDLPFPLSSLDNRMKAKYIKLQTHKFLPGFDCYIWIDGRVEVTASNFVETFSEYSKWQDMFCLRHPERENVYDELQFIGDLLTEGNEYLNKRYTVEIIMEEFSFHLANGTPEDYPLFACGVFSRMNNNRMNDFFDKWWEKCLQYSCFDQAMFSHCAWKEDIDIASIPYNNEFVKINKHL